MDGDNKKVKKNEPYDFERFRARRTKAWPKNSLFGAGLELLDKNQLEDLKKINARAFELEEIENKTKKKKELPTAYQAYMPGEPRHF